MEWFDSVQGWRVRITYNRPNVIHIEKKPVTTEKGNWHECMLVDEKNEETEITINSVLKSS